MTKGQWLAVSACLFLFVALLFANTKPLPIAAPAPTAVASVSFSPDQLIESTRKELDASENQHLKLLEAGYISQKLNFTDSLVAFYDAQTRPAISAYYLEQKAVASNLATDWFKAGERYYIATHFPEPADKQALFSRSIACYKKVLETEPSNTDASTNLAVCYVEGTSQPMQGITMLKEIVEKNPNNINAQLNLGFMSVKSGQFDKAIERFNKVLEINSNMIDTYLYLADAYEKNGEKQRALEALEKYRNLVEDPTIKNEVEGYINKLKNT